VAWAHGVDAGGRGQQMSGPAASVSFDPRPLVDPVDRSAVRAYYQRLRQSGMVGSPFGSAATVVPVVIGAALFLVFGSVFLTVVGSIISSLASATTGDMGVPFLFSAFGALLPIVVVGGALAAVIVYVARGTFGRQERSYRLDRFATANGMGYLPALASPALPGMIFSVGGSRAASDLVRGEQPRFVEFANYQYTTGSGKNRTTHRWGYVAIKLDVPLPHIVLDARSNNGLFGSNLPATFDKDQRLSLEGDFDQHFSLYCPEGYERDALYLFTPDIMARFIDNAAALDVEIVDDWLFLYGKREFSGLDPATWAWLFSVVAVLLDKFAQWARWRDERLQADAAAAAAAMPGAVGASPESAATADGGGFTASATTASGTALPFAAPPGLLRPPAGVAPSGRRLTRGVSWVSIVAVCAVVLFWLFTQLGGFALFAP
ncbi:MAG TPA: hypothetical protein VEX12_01165, partial [Microbacterium sp.]|nr:hypothetical protein [Microbacterium sp.]